jgi:hypothetical protein
MIAAVEKERIGGDHERGSALLKKGFESAVDLAFCTCPEDRKLQRTHTRCNLHFRYTLFP